MEEFRSRVYTDRPPYADYPAPQKFQAIKGIIARRLKEHPKAICSYSGGSDSDIMIDMIEQVRKIYSLPPVDYCFFNTGLEMDATKRHVRETAQKYGVEIREYRPKKNIVQATREYGQPFVSKIMSQGLSGVQRKGIPLSIADEYAEAEDKAAKRKELKERYTGCEKEINFLCCCNSAGEQLHNTQIVINSSKYMLDFIRENPIPFKVSDKCCDICKKSVAHSIHKGYEIVITGERREEGGFGRYRKKAAHRCASPKQPMERSGFVHSTTFPTAIKRGTKSTTEYDTPTHTRSTVWSGPAAVDVPFRRGRSRIWRRYAHMNRTL